MRELVEECAFRLQRLHLSNVLAQEGHFFEDLGFGFAFVFHRRLLANRRKYFPDSTIDGIVGNSVGLRN